VSVVCRKFQIVVVAFDVPLVSANPLQGDSSWRVHPGADARSPFSQKMLFIDLDVFLFPNVVFLLLQIFPASATSRSNRHTKIGVIQNPITEVFSMASSKSALLLLPAGTTESFCVLLPLNVPLGV